MSDIRAIVIRGDFSEAEFTQLVALIREMDQARPGTFFEIVAVDPTANSLEIADQLLRGAMPKRDDRHTDWFVFKNP